MSSKQEVIFKDLGVISFDQAWGFQTERLEELKAIKKQNRDGSSQLKQKHYLLFCEHKPVYTLGKSGSVDHLLLDEEGLKEEGFEYFKINRGGDITYHGPGQLTVYPILDLDYFFNDVHKYVRNLEEIVIRTLSKFGIKGQREQAYTGVWIDGAVKRKICAIGVHMSRWVTMHGFALNVNTDLSHFKNIIPCGIQEEGKTVTSMCNEVDEVVNMEDVKNEIRKQFEIVFDLKIIS